jgi:hypothetical protein
MRLLYILTLCVGLIGCAQREYKAYKFKIVTPTGATYGTLTVHSCDKPKAYIRYGIATIATMDQHGSWHNSCAYPAGWLILEE